MFPSPEHWLSPFIWMVKINHQARSRAASKNLMDGDNQKGVAVCFFKWLLPDVSTSKIVSANPPVRLTTGTDPYFKAIICVNPHGQMKDRAQSSITSGINVMGQLFLMMQNQMHVGMIRILVFEGMEIGRNGWNWT